MEVTPGSVIAGRFEVLKRIGAGGMGMVFTAVDRELNDNVIALKLLLPHLASDEQVFKRFLNEVLVARSLSHPNICRIHDIGKAESGYYYISMEFVDGVSLKERISPEGGEGSGSSTATSFTPLTFEPALQIFAEITSGVAYAHSKEVIHRDLKPGNVLISKRGDVKLADFGTARMSGRDTSLTQTGQVIGTPDYMSPEQIRGEALDSGCDIYSLGIIGYELITGERPYIADSAVAVAFKHLSEPLPPFPERLKSVPNWYRDIIVKATSKARGDRYKNGMELMGDLQKHFRFDVQGTKFFAATGGFPSESGRFEMGDNAAAAPGKDWQFGGSGEAPPQLAFKKKSAGWLLPLILVLLVAGGGAAFFQFRDRFMPAGVSGSDQSAHLTAQEIADQIARADKTPAATAIPIASATAQPTVASVMTAAPTAAPTTAFTATPEPTAPPTAAPTVKPTEIPTPIPTKVHISADLRLKVKGTETTDLAADDVRQAVWTIALKGLQLDDASSLAISLVNGERGSLVAHLHPDDSGSRGDGIMLEGRFEGPARSLASGNYRLEVLRAGELLASRRFSVESSTPGTPAPVVPTSAPSAAVTEPVATEAPAISRSYSGTIDLPGDDGLATRQISLSLTFTGPNITGSATIQGYGTLGASGNELVRGYEIILRGETISLKLTSGKGDASLRGPYVVAGKPIRGSWEVKRSGN